MDIGRVGIWTSLLDTQPSARAQEAVAVLEDLGYPAIWFPESRGRESFTHASLLLAGTRRIVVATGITNMWARDAMAMMGAHRTLTEAFPDRFLLGIGVSHAPTVEHLRGHRYEKPLAAMRAYLDAMDAAPFLAAGPSTEPVRVLAALGPKMLELAARRSAGAHPYFVPVEHTALAREVLGERPLLAPEQAVVLERDPSTAREIARLHTVRYLQLDNYANNLRRLGYGDDDLRNGGSDRLVDAIVAWGDLDAVAGRVQAHLDAGADHVSVQVLVPAPPRPTDPVSLPLGGWRELAPALLALRSARPTRPIG